MTLENIFLGAVGATGSFLHIPIGYMNFAIDPVWNVGPSLTNPKFTVFDFFQMTFLYNACQIQKVSVRQLQKIEDNLFLLLIRKMLENFGPVSLRILFEDFQ